MENDKKSTKMPDIRPEDFHWVVFGICAGALFMLMLGTIVIMRIIDGQWLSWQLPAVMGVAYIVLVSVVAMFFAIKTVKQEIDKQNK